MSELLDETHLLVSSLLLYLHENTPITPSFSCRKKVRQPVDEESSTPIIPPAAPVITAPSAATPVANVQKKPPAPIAQKPAPPREPEPQLAPAHIYSPFIQTLSQAITPPPPPYLDDILEKIQHFGGASLNKESFANEPEELLTWKKEYPQFAIVSFFPKASQEEQFLQKVGQAIASRLLLSTAFFSMPSSQAAAELACYSSSGILKTVLFVHDLALQQKAFEWLASFPSLENLDASQHLEPLAPKKKLFSTPFYQLSLPSHYEQSADFKASLWKALQQLLSR